MLAVSLLVGCAARRPVVYRGEHPDPTAAALIDRDVEACLAVGERYRSPGGAGATGDAARGVAVGGAVGGAAGAAGGAIYGGAGRGAAAGAAAGAAGGLVGGLLRRRGPDPAYRAAVDRCLSDRGHHVIAWE
jgi:outer membrane lipoprotein SlyB